ncbi:MAG TPA: hypothetical protein VE915_02805, partial [Actinomycetota bacterium]|nr:hypothetical protein [Actinomycetota bacterium]
MITEYAEAVRRDGPGTPPEPNLLPLERMRYDCRGMMEMVIEPERLLGLAEEMATRAHEQDAGHGAVAVL